MSVVFIMASYTDRHKILRGLSKGVDGTAHTGRPVVEDMGVNHIGLLGPAAVMALAQGFPQLIEEFRFGGSRGIGRVTQPAFPEGVWSRWVETIFSGALVPVIPLPQNQFETFGKNLRSRAADQRIRWKTGGTPSSSGAFVNHFKV